MTGRLESERLEEALDQLDEPEAAGDPQGGGEEADQRGLDQDRRQDLPGGRAQGAEHRELPDALCDRDRECVEDQEAADEHRDAREDEQRGGEEAEALLDVAGVFIGRLAPGLGRRIPRRPRPRRRGASCSGVVPSSATMSISSNLPCLSVRRCASGRVNSARLAPPRGRAAPELGDADQRVGPGAGGSRDPHLVADLEPGVLGARRVERDLVGGDGLCALDHAQRLELGVSAVDAAIWGGPPCGGPIRSPSSPRIVIVGVCDHALCLRDAATPRTVSSTDSSKPATGAAGRTAARRATRRLHGHVDLRVDLAKRSSNELSTDSLRTGCRRPSRRRRRRRARSRAPGTCGPRSCVARVRASRSRRAQADRMSSSTSPRRSTVVSVATLPSTSSTTRSA